MNGLRSGEVIAGPNPFVGPRPFELGERLYGREREISELHFRLNAERIVLLHSPSGAGKSSLVQAGLLPLLARTFDVWGPTRVNAEPAVPGINRYTLSTVQGFEEQVPEHLRRPVDALAGQTLATYFEKRPRRRSAPQNTILLFDQFEEILTVDPLAVDAKHELFDQLGDLLRNPRVWALFALREDYLAPLDPYARQVPTHLKNRFRIDLLGLAAAREAMVEPALEGGREFPAVEELVHDLATMKVQQPDGSFVEETGQHVEPVQLQVVCRRLWDAMPPADLSIDAEDLERFGDVTEALAAYYADSVARIAAGDPARERAIRDWFGEALITAGGIRGQVLREAGASGGLANDLIDKLRGTHLVRAETRAGATWYELAHDRLIEPVQRDNAAWREAHLAEVQRRTELWERQGRPAGLLLAGAELTEGERWAAENGALVTEVERTFLAESRKAHEIAEQERRQARRIRRLAIAAAVVGTLALAACGVAAWQWRQADTQKQIAEEQRDRAKDQELRAQSARLEAQRALAERLVSAGQWSQALAYLARVVRLEPENSAERGQVFALLLNGGYPIPNGPLRHEGEICSASFSPDGRRVVTASSDSTARVWDAVTGKPLGEPMHHEDAVVSASFSPDGQRVVTASLDSTAQVWDAATGKPLGAPIHHEHGVKSASFSPEGRRVVTASDKTAQVWDAATGEPLGAPLRHEEEVHSASFSPEGRRVVTVSVDTVRVWDAATGEPSGEPMRHENFVTSASFSPDGRRVVMASIDTTAQVWDAVTRQPLGEPLSHEGPVYSASFSPDGRRVVTASVDQTARLWDAATGQPLGEPLRHEDVVRSASFSPDGQRVVTATRDGTAWLWDVAPGKLVGQPLRHTTEFWSGSFSPDGRWVVTTSSDQTARLWDAATGRPLGEPLRHESAVYSVSFSPDGRRVVTASEDGTAQVWDVATGEKLGEPLHHEKVVRSASFRADGRRVVTASEDGTARVWDAVTGKPLGEPLRHQGSVISASFSPDGRRVLTASDHTARVWDGATGQPLGEPMRHEDKVFSASFSPDGRRVVTASSDKTAQVWDTAGKRLGEPMHHNRAVMSASFSPDGRRVVTASMDFTARVWDAATGKPLGEPLRHEREMLNAGSFSPDGRRVATASQRAARVWNAATGTLLGEPLPHADEVNSAAFSPDGQRVVTASGDGTARLWDVLTASASEAGIVAEMAEVMGGYRVTDLGNLEPIPLPERSERMAALRRLGRRARDREPTVTSFLRWYFTPRFERTISPLSKMTVEEYIKHLLALSTEEARQEAWEAFPGHPLFAQGQP